MFKFRASDDIAEHFSHPEGHPGEGPISIVIWTTTPWTLPANRAISVHPGLKYALVQVETETGPQRFDF